MFATSSRPSAPLRVDAGRTSGSHSVRWSASKPGADETEIIRAVTVLPTRFFCPSCGLGSMDTPSSTQRTRAASSRLRSGTSPQTISTSSGTGQTSWNPSTGTLTLRATLDSLAICALNLSRRSCGRTRRVVEHRCRCRLAMSKTCNILPLQAASRSSGPEIAAVARTKRASTGESSFRGPFIITVVARRRSTRRRRR